MRSAFLVSIAALSLAPVTASADDVAHPPFIKAAVFFVRGLVPPPVAFDSDVAAHVDKLALHGPYTGPARFSTGDPNFECTLYQQQSEAPYSFSRYNFDNFPSPNTAKIGPMPGGGAQATFVFPNNTWCTQRGFVAADGTKSPVPHTTMCATTVIIGDPNAGTLARRLQALWYIRDSFCPGLQDPPRAPF